VGLKDIMPWSIYYKPFKEEERKEKYLESKYPNFKEKHVEHHPKKD